MANFNIGKPRNIKTSYIGLWEIVIGSVRYIDQIINRLVEKIIRTSLKVIKQMQLE